MSVKNEKTLSRRKFFARIFQTAGISIAAGTLWSSYLAQGRAQDMALRPPGALPRDNFLAACIKCGLCVEACANRDSLGTRLPTLKLASPDDGVMEGTPFFVPRESPCYMCKDVPCTVACPTGALDVKNLIATDDEEELVDIALGKMGVAVIDTANCIAYNEWGIQCDICYRACPLMDQALKLEYRHNSRTGKHSFVVPVVDNDTCTGCGICEQRCPTKKSSITVVAREKIIGRPGAHYVRGWKKTDRHIEHEREQEIRQQEYSTGGAVDYLNGDVSHE